MRLEGNGFGPSVVSLEQYFFRNFFQVRLLEPGPQRHPPQHHGLRAGDGDLQIPVDRKSEVAPS